MEVAWLALLGLGIGTLSVLVGTGGGLLLVPLLLILFDLDPETVAGTALALVSVNSFMGTAAYGRLGFVDVRSGLLFAGAAVPGSVIAPFLVKAVSGGVFRVLLGLLLMVVAIQMSLRPRPSQASSETRRPTTRFAARREISSRDGEVYRYEFNALLATSFNVALGFMSGFFGTGGGFIRTPILVAVFGFPVRVAVATSLAALSVYATAGAIVHLSLGHVDLYPTFVGAGAGLLVGSQIGARLLTVIRTQWVMRLLFLILLGMGSRLLAEGLFA